VFWINVSASGYGNLSSEAAELTDLTGGLILNASGNYTGNLLIVTPYLSTLGLPANVRTALANATMANTGAYAPPTYQQPPGSPSPWQVIGSAICNTVSGVISTGVGALSAGWNTLVASTAYIAELGAKLLALGISLLANQFEKAVKAIASAMEWAINELAQWIIWEIEGAVGLVVTTVKDALSGYTNNILGAEKKVLNDISTGASVTSTYNDLARMYLSFLGLESLSSDFATVLSVVGTVLQPVLQLLNPVTVVQDLGGLLSSSLGPNSVSHFAGVLNGLLGALIGTIATGFEGLFQWTGTGSRGVSPWNSTLPHPTDYSVSDFVGNGSTALGNRSYTSNFGTTLSQSKAVPDVLDAASIGIVMGLIGFLAFQNVNVLIPGANLYSGTFYSMWQVLYGGAHPTPIQVFLLLGMCMVVSLISLLLPANDGYYEILTSTIGGTLAGLEYAYDFKELDEASPWALVIGGIETGVAVATPVTEVLAGG
jgi:hypothetical protein